MFKITNENKQWICESCPANQGETCGPFQENSDIFLQCKQFHNCHEGWKEYQHQPTEIETKSDSNPLQVGVNAVCDIFKKSEEGTDTILRKYGDGIEQVESYCNKIIKEDPKLVQKLLRVCFSAYTGNPVNLAIMAPTSEGKTYATVMITDLFPAKDVIFIGKMSPTALIHQKGKLVDSEGNEIQAKLDELDSMLENKEDRKEIQQQRKQLLAGAKNLVDLRHKILVFAEPPDPQLLEVLKPIMSHDREEIEYKTTMGDGSLHVKETIIRGFPAIIVCTAKNEKMNRVWDEMETRFDMASPNTTVKKYRSAVRLTSQKRGIPSIIKNAIFDEDEKTCAKYNIHRIKDHIVEYHKDEKNPVFNPFYEIIGDSFPADEGINMRNSDRFFTYCNVETVIHADKRCRIQFKDRKGNIKKVIVTSEKDISRAVELMGELSTIPPEKRNFLQDVFDSCVGGSLDNSTTTENLVKKYSEVYSGKTIDGKKMLDNYLDPLSKDYGILEGLQDEADKRRKRWKYSSKPNSNSLDFIRQLIIEESKKNKLFVKERTNALLEYSDKTLELDSVLDSNGIPISIDELQDRLVPPESSISGGIQEQNQEQTESFESSKTVSEHA